MSARITTNYSDLIAHSILDGPFPTLPMPVTPSLKQKADGRKANGRKPNPSAPWCIRCRAHMKQRPGPKGKRWACTICDRSIYQHSVGEPSAGGPWGKMMASSHPCCLRCRQPMAKHSKGIWRCRCSGKGIYANAHRTQSQAPRRRTASGRLRTATGRAKRKRRTSRFVARPDYPHCIKCRWQMRLCGSAPKKRWECNLCGASCVKSRSVAHGHALMSGEALMRFCFNAVPRSFAVREDLAQELLLMILSKQLCTCEVTPLKVRQVGRAILKSQSEFANISLETPNREGVRLEERLVG